MPQVTMSQKTKYKHYFLVLIAMLIYGSANPVMRQMMQQGVDPYALSGVRSVLAMLFALPVMAFAHDRPHFSALKGRVLPVVAISFTGIFIMFILTCLGLRYTQAGKSALIIASSPIFTVFLSTLILKEPGSKRKLLGILVAMIGTAFCLLGDLTGGSLSFQAWDLVFFATAFFWSIYTLLNRHYGHEMRYTQLYFWMYAISSLMFLPVLIAHWPGVLALTWPQFGWIVYLAAMPSSVAYLLLLRGVNVIGASAVGMINSMVPLSAIIISAIWLGERLTPVQLLGGLVLIGGVCLGLNKVKLPVNYETGVSLTEGEDAS